MTHPFTSFKCVVHALICPSPHLLPLHFQGHHGRMWPGGGYFECVNAGLEAIERQVDTQHAVEHVEPGGHHLGALSEHGMRSVLLGFPEHITGVILLRRIHDAVYADLTAQRRTEADGGHLVHELVNLLPSLLTKTGKSVADSLCPRSVSSRPTHDNADHDHGSKHPS
jgi:hypothetical protein